MTAVAIAIFIFAVGVYLWHGQKTHAAANRSQAKAPPKAKKPVPTAQELADAVTDRKSYNQLLARLERETEKGSNLTSHAAIDRNSMLVAALEEAVELVEAKYPGTQHGGGSWDAPGDWG